MRQATELAPEMTYTLSYLGCFQGMTGQEKEARQTLERLDRMAREHYISPIAHANVHYGLGEFDLALDYLDEACSIKEPLLIFAHSFPILDRLRDRPRYTEILKRMGLPS